ncbi:MAG: hypothetical protein FIA98_09820, partial [Anaerolineae bacterium]|nr:hypothetical protein [Anaerolineae bacterium]
MPHLRIRYLIPIFLGALFIAGFLLIINTQPTQAQCGSQASSCKNCHETQGQDPVNSDGTAWHSEHAQIDACVSCHAGNPQSTDKTQSHTGMVPWNSDVKAGCASCHPADYEQLAGQYATTLGVTLGGGGGAATPMATQATAPTASTEETLPSGGGMVVSQPGTIDYVQQYQETVLGEYTINWGNVILVVLILVLLVGGGAFIYWNERRRKGLKGFFTPKASGTPEAGVIPEVEGYTREVSELLPLIARLNPVGLHALKRILANPEQANEMLHALSHLDPELLRRVQALDK